MQSSFFFGCVLVKTFKTVFKNIQSLSFNLFTHTHIYIYIYMNISTSHINVIYLLKL